MSDVKEDDAPEPEFRHPMNVGYAIVTFLLYLAQMVPCAVFITLYPILYGLRGFSEDDLSQLELGAIPWCLKFIPGYIFESMWRPPRWVLVCLQVVIGGITAALAFVPIENVGLTSGIYYVYSVIVICHDVVFDGGMIRIFGHWGALLSLVQQFAYYAFDTLLCFIAVGNFNQMILLYTGIGCAVVSPLVYVYTWPDVPLVNLKGCWRDFKKTAMSFFVGICYFMNSTFSEAMLPYFATDMALDDWEAGRLVGFYNVGLLMGVSCGQYLFNGLRYRWCILAAMTSETLGVFIVLFLHEHINDAALCALFWLFGIVTSVTDSIVQCYLVDACDVTRTPTFCYACFQSCYELGDTVGFTLYPQAKSGLAWRDYWICDSLQSAGVTFMFTIAFLLLPQGWKDPVLNRVPSLNWREICRCCAPETSEDQKGDEGKGLSTLGAVEEEGDFAGEL